MQRQPLLGGLTRRVRHTSKPKFVRANTVKNIKSESKEKNFDLILFAEGIKTTRKNEIEKKNPCKRLGEAHKRLNQ